jgi:hypothetical protein
VARGQLPSLADLASSQTAPGEDPPGSEAASAPDASAPAPDAPADAAAADSDTAAQVPEAAARIPAARRFVPRLLEVVVSVAETGWQFIRTASGWLPVADGSLTGFLSPAQAVPLANLRIAAIAAAEKASGGRYRPAAVDRYLLARSGGYCEIGTCKGRVVAAHHRNRYSFDPSHHPDAIVCVCAPHHGLPHGGEIEDERVDPQAWTVRQAECDSREMAADTQFQAHRRASAAGT